MKWENFGEEVKQNYLDTNSLDEISYTNSISIITCDELGNINYAVGSMDNKTFYMDLSFAINKYNTSNVSSVTYIMKITRINTQSMVYVSKIDNTYVILSVNIEPMGAAVNVLQNQMKYITVIMLILSIILSIYFSNKLIKPIKEITDKASLLGKGNYDVKFEETEYNELNNLVDTLNYSAIEFKKTDSLRKELIANVSHDIKTPITIIKAYAEMIKDISGDDKKKREEHLDVIINQTDLLTKLINDMMDLSKLETGVTSLNLESFDIVDVSSDILNGFKYLIDYTFILNIQDNKSDSENVDKNSVQNSLKKEIIVYADRIKISQVLYNLIGNAVNYVGEDKEVVLNIYRKNGIVRVEVEDHGKGIEDTTHIFDRYYKSNDKFRKSGFGTGLGLSIVKNILELHKFKYGVESKINKGTTFYFEINNKN